MHCNLDQVSLTHAGEEASVSLIQQCEREGMVDGILNPLHQGDRRPPWQGGAPGGPEEWSRRSFHIQGIAVPHMLCY